MKQTNNALKFLLAQYRAIFKNAYFKGLTTAMVVTAGLAAAQGAQAAANDATLEASELTGLTEVTITGGSESGSDNKTWGHLAIQESATLDANITIKGGAAGFASGNNFIKSSGSAAAVISGSGSLKIDSAGGSTVGVMIGQADASQDIELNIKSIDVQNGTLSAVNGGTQSGDVTIAADTITVGNNGIITIDSKSNNTKTITLGRAASTGVTGSTINIDGKLELKTVLPKILYF